jgi:hypothetical protein
MKKYSDTEKFTRAILYNPLGIFPDWFANLVFILFGVVLILTILNLALCPPCQICVGTRIGQVCIERLPDVRELIPWSEI